MTPLDVENDTSGLIVFTANWCGDQCDQWNEWVHAKTNGSELDVLIVDVDNDAAIADIWNYTWALDVRKDTTLSLPHTICVYNETNHVYAFDLTEFALEQFVDRCKHKRLHIPLIRDMGQVDAWTETSSSPLLISWSPRPHPFGICKQLPYVHCAWLQSELELISVRSIHGEWHYIFHGAFIPHLLGRFIPSERVDDPIMSASIPLVQHHIHLYGCTNQTVWESYLLNYSDTIVITYDTDVTGLIFQYRNIEWEVEDACEHLPARMEDIMQHRLEPLTRPWKAAPPAEHALTRVITSSELSDALETHADVVLYLRTGTSSRACLHEWYDRLEREENTTTRFYEMDVEHNDHEKLSYRAARDMTLTFENGTYRSTYACTDRT